MTVERDMPGRAIGGCTARAVAPHLICHMVPDDVMLRNLPGIFESHLGAGYYGLIVYGNGSAMFAGAEPSTPPPGAEKMHTMLEVCRAMNRRLSAKGFWACGHHRDGYFAFYWFDRNGVCRLEYGVTETWERVRRWKIDDFLAAAAQCMRESAELIDELALDALFRSQIAGESRANGAAHKFRRG